MTDLVPLILCALDDAVRAKSLAAPEDADLAALADGLTLAVDHGLVADVWNRDVPELMVEHITGILTSTQEWEEWEEYTPAETHRVEVAVARRLADVAASLCVRGMALRREAEALWRAASRLLGMDVGPAADITVDAMESARAEMKRSHAEVDKLALEVDKLVLQIDDLKRKHDNAERGWKIEHELAEGCKRNLCSVREEFDTLKRKHAEDDRALVEAHARELREAKEAHAKEVADLRASVPYGGRLADSMAETSEWRDAYASLERAVCQVLTTANLGHMLRPGNIMRLDPGDEWKFALLAVVARATQKAPTRDDGTLVLSDWTTTARNAILADCAYECAVYHGPAQGEMRVVVGLRDGKTMGDVAAVLERMGRAPGTYSLREVKHEHTRRNRQCNHRPDGDAAACDHCSHKG